jgi:hypothetical protein
VKPKKHKIRLHEKALAHLSRGLYRSPASVLRELVSNSWDANATEVRINTNAPTFYQLSAKDNGDGFSRQEFESLMEGGIGNSSKRSDSYDLIHARPLIGRLGIGMLGIAQICTAFSIISIPKKGEPFKARVDLYDLLKERLDKNEGDVVQQVPGQKVTEVYAGEYAFEEFDQSEYDQGTYILADNLHPTFTQTFQESVEHEQYVPVPLNWENALQVISKVRSLQELGEYWRLIWELAAACPIPYLNKTSIPAGLIKADQERLQSYNFRLIIDGIELYKPVHLKGNPNGYTTYRFAETTYQVYGNPLTYHGYIAVQEGLSLRPDELRGIMIRIKNVGIGYYDPSMLDYRFNEGPRSRWLTGEIYVDAGLEDALNVDRDSFNKFHPEYRALQEQIHKILQKFIFAEVYKKIKDRSDEKAELKYEERAALLARIIAEHFTDAVKIEETSDFQTDRNHIPLVRTYNDRDGYVHLLIPTPTSFRTKKSNKQLAAYALALYVLSKQERKSELREAAFSSMLLQMLSKW